MGLYDVDNFVSLNANSPFKNKSITKRHPLPEKKLSNNLDFMIG